MINMKDIKEFLINKSINENNDKQIIDINKSQGKTHFTLASENIQETYVIKNKSDLIKVLNKVSNSYGRTVDSKFFKDYINDTKGLLILLYNKYEQEWSERNYCYYSSDNFDEDFYYEINNNSDGYAFLTCEDWNDEIVSKDNMELFYMKSIALSKKYYAGENNDKKIKFNKLEKTFSNFKNGNVECLGYHLGVSINNKTGITQYIIRFKGGTNSKGVCWEDEYYNALFIPETFSFKGFKNDSD